MLLSKLYISCMYMYVCHVCYFKTRKCTRTCMHMYVMYVHIDMYYNLDACQCVYISSNKNHSNKNILVQQQRLDCFPATWKYKRIKFHYI